MHDLDAVREMGRPQNTLAAAAINRIQQVTENYISEKLAQTSAPIRNALVRANIARLEYILNTQTQAHMPTEPNDTYIQPYICLHERCCSDKEDEQQQIQRPFADAKFWAGHMWSGLHHVDWWLCDPRPFAQHTPIRFDDIEAFREHLYLEHEHGEHVDGGCRDEYILPTALTRARKAEQDPISRCMLCHNAHNCMVPNGAQKLHQRSPFSSSEVQQHVAQHLRDVADLAYREACAVLPLLPTREQLPAKTNSRGARNILHHVALDESGQFMEALMLTGGRNIQRLVEQPDTCGETPLHYAARSHFGVKFLCVLLGEPRDSWCRVCHSWEGSPEVPTAAHLAERHRLLSLRDSFGRTPLLVAVMHNQYRTVCRMLENWQVAIDATALSWAARQDKDGRMVELLLEHAADVSAGADNSCDAVQLLPPLHEAAAQGREDIVRLLLGASTDTDQPSRAGLALHLAAGAGHNTIVKLLVRDGAYVEAATPEGLTALHAAARTGRADMIKLLMDRGARATLGTKSGWMPLHYAAVFGHRDAAAMLLPYCDPSALVCGWSALDLATYYARSSVIDLLREVSSAGHRQGRHMPTGLPPPLDVIPPPTTPLQTAAATGNVPLAKMLLPISDVLELCPAGVSALVHAACKGHAEMVALLLRRGADTTLPPGVSHWSAIVAVNAEAIWAILPPSLRSGV